MKRWLLIILLLLLWPLATDAQQAGYVWTYMGATLGPQWQPPATGGTDKPISIGWIAGVNPNGSIMLAGAEQPLTIKTIIGVPEIALGAAGTVDIYDAAAGTACSSGIKVTTSSFNANGTAAANQSLLSSPYSLSFGHSLCVQVSGSAWATGASIATITAYAS